MGRTTMLFGNHMINDKINATILPPDTTVFAASTSTLLNSLPKGRANVGHGYFLIRRRAFALTKVSK